MSKIMGIEGNVIYMPPGRLSSKPWPISRHGFRI